MEESFFFFSDDLKPYKTSAMEKGSVISPGVHCTGLGVCGFRSRPVKIFQTKKSVSGIR